ncbi:aquaporin-11 [Sitophilus oryzae]|uniref:Aquaporin n=1 Tax=Sitophilus oryzae TaxID=7048 RepID=A0A6J2Y1K8_SITOR|nr:aquaporin-11 [Sitophilus oryzae]
MAKWTVERALTKVVKKLGILGYNKRRNIYGVNPLIISTSYILLTLLLANLARKLVERFIDESKQVVRDLLYEFIATLELCACCFELIIVADNWGVTAYAIFLVLLTIWWSTKWGNASACPYSPIEEILEGTRCLKDALYVIGVQVLAAFLTFRYIQVLWSLELVETHMDKAYEDCTADLQVDMISGAVIEATLTCFCRLASRILAETSWKYSHILDAVFGTLMVVAAFNFSGGYFNPALATSLKFGCTGNTFAEHVIVYWLGAFLGSAISVIIFNSNVVQQKIKSCKGELWHNQEINNASGFKEE